MLGGIVVVPIGLLAAVTGRALAASPDQAAIQTSAARARATVMEVERRLGFEPTDRELLAPLGNAAPPRSQTRALGEIR